MLERMVMRRVREGEVPPDGATALQDDPDRPVFRGNGPYDYVCVECGNVLAHAVGLEQMTKRVRVKCGRCRTVNVAAVDWKGDTRPPGEVAGGASPGGLVPPPREGRRA